MPSFPSRQPPTPGEQLRIVLEGQAGGSLRGRTRWGRRIGAQESAAAIPVPTLALVKHYDDPDVPRPLATFVLWAGAADPTNKAPWDIRYPANDFDDD